MEYELGLAALTFFFLLASLFCYSWIVVLGNSKIRTEPPLPPGPYGLPILGYLPFLKHNLHHQFTQLSHKYGPIYRLWLGSKLCVVVSSPSLIKQIVRDHDSTFANRDPPVAALVATGGYDIVWTANGPYWRDIRKLFVREMMSNTNLQASNVFRTEEVRKLIGNLDTQIGSPVQIGELIFLTELHVLMSLLWGGEMDPTERSRLGDKFRVHISKLVDLLGKPNVSDFFPVLARFDLQGIAKEMRGVVVEVERILDCFIDAKVKSMAAGGGMEGEERSKDFMGILLELKDKQLGEGSTFGLTQIKAILVDIVAGGSDTTATMVEWVMTELLHNPSIMQKVQQEVTNVVGANNVVEESHVSKLHYLEAVVKETFRLHPPLPLLVPRYPSESCTIGEHTIPKGSRVFLNMWSIHMDPHAWENPLQFRPERFLNDNSEKFDFIGNNVEYLPFGSGRRVCPGIPLAEKMVMYLLETLVHTYEWGLPEGQKIDLSEKFGIVMRKETPLIAVPYHK
ncbi:hypothetical protein ABFS82_05G084300 [Erythranthe guttata]|nr:PREDICTED: cytochrome P450 76C1-like [Erythranthe guttata]|eukprot:XP_012856988.1 PREDICTED: cytochrome P450 76C1-like [Erythranthe guttata]